MKMLELKALIDDLIINYGVSDLDVRINDRDFVPSDITVHIGLNKSEHQVEIGN